MPSLSRKPARGSRFPAEQAGVDLNEIASADLPFLSRRAALRRRALADYRIPPTSGPREGAERAGMIFTGVPEATAEEAAQAALRGAVPAIEKGAETASEYVARVLKPIVGKSVKGF